MTLDALSNNLLATFATTILVCGAVWIASQLKRLQDSKCYNNNNNTTKLSKRKRKTGQTKRLMTLKSRSSHKKSRQSKREKEESNRLRSKAKKTKKNKKKRKASQATEDEAIVRQNIHSRPCMPDTHIGNDDSKSDTADSMHRIVSKLADGASTGVASSVKRSNKMEPLATTIFEWLNQRAFMGFLAGQNTKRSEAQIRRVPSSAWFFELFGVHENFMDIHKLFEYDNDTGTLKGPNGKVYRTGQFSRPSVLELRREMKTFRSGQLKVDHVATDDVMEMHGEIANRHACFQVASQFNCLEFPAEYVTPEEGVTQYVRDPTQGPACAVAAGPATVFRNYFVPVGNNIVGQSRDHQLDNFEDLGKVLVDGGDFEGSNKNKPLVVVRNGYTSSTGKMLEKAVKIIGDHKEELIGRLRVGVQHEAQVTSCGRSYSSDFGAEQIHLLDDPEQRVTQVYCSAISCGYTSLTSESWGPVAKLVLDATYEATLLAAARSYRDNGKSNRVFLTFIGGGVFQNRREWIVSSINRALRRVADLDLHVTIVHYRSINPATKSAILSHFV